jgi:hypothetical protein
LLFPAFSIERLYLPSEISSFQTMKYSAQLAHRRLPAILAFLAVGFAALFIIPFHIPVSPVMSDSYDFGFSNRAALIIFVAFAAIFAYWSGGLGLLAKQPEDVSGVKPMSRRLLYVTLAITAAINLACWFAYRKIGAFNEGSYEFDRLLQLASGHVPFRDFEFIYGPFILYFPFLLYRLLHLPLLDAYFLSWTVEWLGGVYLLWLTIDWVGTTSSRRNGLYLLVFFNFIFATIAMGTNYTPVRFISAPFFAILTWRTLRSGRSPLLATLTAIAGAAWVLFYSPEQGIAFIGGSFVFFVIFLKRRHLVGWNSIVLLTTGFALLLLLAARLHVLDNMLAAAAGGLNLPVLPSIGILTMLLLLIASTCILLNAVRLNHPGTPLEYLILVAICALPAALGRADFGHIFMNCLGAFIASWIVLSYYPLGGKWMFWSFLLGALGMPISLYQENNVVMMPLKQALLAPGNPHPALRDTTLRAMNRVLGPARTQAELSKWSREFPVPVSNWNTPTARPLFAPLGYPSNVSLGTNLPPIEEGKYRSLGNVMQRYQVEEKVDELRSRPDQLLLFPADSLCPPPGAPANTGANDPERRRQLLLNLQSFYVPHIKHHEDLAAPLCAYVNAHYTKTSYIAPLAGGEIWQRVPGK